VVTLFLNPLKTKDKKKKKEEEEEKKMTKRCSKKHYLDIRLRPRC
jgi:hypothetical protein